MKLPTPIILASQLPSAQILPTTTPPYTTSLTPLQSLQTSLATLQTTFFNHEKGAWPTAIDWTSSVINTILLASLQTLTAAPINTTPADAHETQTQIRDAFADSVAYYTHESMAAFPHHAIDDMLWVVLNWLEALTYLQTTHAATPPNLHHAFASRAERFYATAAQAWDTTLCAGGILWNPTIAPYKNAITNQLYVSASTALHRSSPATNTTTYLSTAIAAYAWLNASGMRNPQGLYIDGFHIRGSDVRSGDLGSAECDVRNEEVWTYNQGVVLSGLRGLYEGTGEVGYLRDGYALVDDAVAATGWSSSETTAAGILGENGILADPCDAFGTCTQNAQTFKAAFFHHLTAFCAPLPGAGSHEERCRGYAGWVEWNARAALRSRGDGGKFGGWWGEDGEVGDVNERGRGRTVEAFVSGVAVVRAWVEWERWYPQE
ncbi:glycoside hydrolase family 76 protein [Teratosphaeria destructans]|uniref:Glycoside hydrolase family 76 protein n=1 Tax=Teratosphaeria destructans TaxID=418781 RepID=A0A9W7SVM1_9PEZI|nr:glycoside hydrolase family 76 protein [Teratosphaeria destructans]